MSLARSHLMAVILLLGGCWSPASTELSNAMDLVERSVVLPPTAQPLQAYERFYFRRDDGNIGAIYVTGEKPGRQWVERPEKAPAVLDGGCGVVNVVFDVATKAVSAICNGDA